MNAGAEFKERPRPLIAPGLPSGWLLLVAGLGIALDVGVARITFGVALPAFTRDLGLSFTIAGALGTLHLIGYLAGTLASPWANNRIGAVRLCRISHLAFAGGMLISGVANGPLLLALGRIVAGLAAGFGVFSLFVIVFAACDPRSRAIAGSMVWSGIGAAIVVSGVVSKPLLEVAGAWRWSFLVPAALALCVAWFLPVQKAGVAAPSAQAPAGGRRAGILSAKWLFLIASYFLFGAAYIAYATFAGARLREIDVSAATVSLFWVVFGVSSILGSGLGAALLSGSLRHLSLGAALASGAIGAVLVVFGNTISLFAAAFLVGLGLVATPAITTILVRSRTTDASYPAMFMVATASLGLGQLCGPFAAGVLADHYGPMAIGLFSAALYAAGAAFAWSDGFVSWRSFKDGKSH